MSSLSITEQVLAALKAEAAARLIAEQAAQAAVELARTLERWRHLGQEAKEQQVDQGADRLAAALEAHGRALLALQQALLRAERLEAEQAAAARLVAEQAALAAEVERLRSRSPLEILQDEMAEMKRQMAAASRSPEPEALHLRERVIQLDTLYKSSLEELATARAEIAALKSVVGDLIALRHETPRGGHIPTELNAMRGQGLFERLGVPAYFVTTVNGNQFHRSVPIDWQKYAEKGHDGSDIEYPTLV